MLKYSTIATVFRRLGYDWESVDLWVNDRLTHYFQITTPEGFGSPEEVDLAISEIAGVLSFLKLEHKIIRVSFVEKRRFFIALWVIK